MSQAARVIPEGFDQQLKIVRAEFERALAYQSSDPQASLTKARFLAESICKQIYRIEGCEKGAKPAAKMMLGELVPALHKRGLLPGLIVHNIGTIQHLGNFGAHDQGLESGSITPEGIAPCIAALQYIMSWYFTEYHGQSLSVKGDSQRDQRARDVYADRFRAFLVDDGRIDMDEAQTLRMIAEGFGLNTKEAQEIEDAVRKEVETDANLRLMGSSTQGSSTQSMPAVPGEDLAAQTFEWLEPPEATTASKSLTLQLTGSGKQHTLEMVAGTTASFGRDPSRADFRVLVEPVAPAAQYPDNIEKSKRISGAHLAVDIVQSSAFARDLGSTWGTTIGPTQRLEPNRQLNIREGDQLILADALTLGVQLFRSSDGEVEWVRLPRLSNTQAKSYLVLAGTVWLDETAAGWCGTSQGSVAIRWIDNHAALCNSSTAPISVRDQVLAPGRSHPLFAGLQVRLPSGGILTVV